MASSDYYAKLEQSEEYGWPTCCECIFCHVEQLRGKKDRDFYYCCNGPEVKILEQYRAEYLPGCDKAIPGKPDKVSVSNYSDSYHRFIKGQVA